MSVIKNVVVAGASGILGAPVLNALLDSKQFNVSVLTRHDSKSQFSSDVRVIPVHYDNRAELTTALQGQDAVVSTLSSAALGFEIPLIDAAIATGVKRFIPSEFGSDTDNAKSSTLPVYQTKVAVDKALQQKAREYPNFSYTSIRNGVFLDWGLAFGFHVNFKSENPVFYDGGDRPFSSTTLATIGKSVVSVLTHLQETKNKAIFVHDLVTTQQQVLSIARKIAPARKWEPVTVSTADLEAQSQEQYSKGIISLESSLGFLTRAVFAEGYGGRFKHVDNELLGIGFKTEADLEELVKATLTGSAA
ncbi:hypothetical protein NUU61_003493 [Penicillium alfredii]|uniref:NmrA-like domain-containing protein n=1 Tax=Penicillium alfredii TaxID=1506179 RepID=A0A9W9FJ98_9EURO|nr:uncharacterized protein NUU61_003493 [Penicillium alfredii]KAJ5101271.1 hypothetical protein NUU61_003493 [Penicillium alfredii]